MVECQVAVFCLYAVSIRIYDVSGVDLDFFYVNEWSDRCHLQFGTLRSGDCQLGSVVRDAVRILCLQIYFLEKHIKLREIMAENLKWKSELYCSHTDLVGNLYHVKWLNVPSESSRYVKVNGHLVTQTNLLWPSDAIWCHKAWSTLFGTKPLSEPMLTNHRWGYLTFTWRQFRRRFSKYISLIWV